MKKINVTRSSVPPYEEYCAEIKDLWDSRWLTNMGQKHEELRIKLQEYLGTGHLELLTNGHMSIEVSLQTLGLSGEVITTPFTFASTTQAIVRNSLTPVFCDIDPVTFCMDPEKIEPLITEKTSAILPVHVYGNVCDVETIEAIAKKYNLAVVYDAAHTFGVKYEDKSTANFGDVSCFSFHATKVFHSIEGGCACFQNGEFGARLAKLKNFGLAGQESVEEIGTNAKMDEFRAAMGLCNLRYVDGEIAKRKRVVERYRERLENIPGLQLNPVQKNVRQNFAYFPVVFHEEIFGANRNCVMDKLAENCIHARKYFYPLTSEFSCYKGKFEVQETPLAKEISRKVLTLPLYADLDLADVDRVCDIILNCKK